MKTTRTLTLSCLTTILSILMMVTTSFAEGPNDQDALKGISFGKAIFDINLAKAESMPLYLQVIGMTHEGLVKQGVTTNFIVAFRGPAVQFIIGKVNAGNTADTVVL